MYQRILVPMDGSDTAERGLREAIRLARGQGTQLVLLHVIDDFPSVRQLAASEPLDEQRARRRHAAEQMLAKGVHLADAADVACRTEVCTAIETAANSIVETAVTLQCELIVIGTHGRSGVRRAVLGSVADQVSRHSPLPVLLVPPAAGAPT